MLALEQARHGYRPLAVLVRRGGGEAINEKRIWRLYCLAGLALRKLKRKRIKREALPRLRLTGPNQEWAMDFVSDSAGNGQVLRFFGVDQFTRKCVRLIVDTSISSERVIRELNAAIAEYGSPLQLRMDNGSEFTSRRSMAGGI